MLSQEKKNAGKGQLARRLPCSFFTITLDFVTATLGLAPVFISHIPRYIKATVLLLAGVGGRGAGLCCGGCSFGRGGGAPGSELLCRLQEAPLPEPHSPP